MGGATGRESVTADRRRLSALCSESAETHAVGRQVRRGGITTEQGGDLIKTTDGRREHAFCVDCNMEVKILIGGEGCRRSTTHKPSSFNSPPNRRRPTTADYPTRGGSGSEARSS